MLSIPGRLELCKGAGLYQTLLQGSTSELSSLLHRTQRLCNISSDNSGATHPRNLGFRSHRTTLFVLANLAK
jgi:hypothetical protein